MFQTFNMSSLFLDGLQQLSYVIFLCCFHHQQVFVLTSLSDDWWIFLIEIVGKIIQLWKWLADAFLIAMCATILSICRIAASFEITNQLRVWHQTINLFWRITAEIGCVSTFLAYSGLMFKPGNILVKTALLDIIFFVLRRLF